ncbi:sporulation protein YqfC [Sporobacter termitidis DSM 10068]|uniref:Sporulation protein YqfC n=1 Tax=Sporobacter termitidis DSM 10068 TaxID=1123282 RepID=A0A1M5WYW9_9FIRM|nr:YabP/YqfC family sporulation protein [Sporobacter termitidis]SHH92532.1 sporulation protein YqfC [Sporobacter termitidis DSM 10068]
MNTDKNKKNIIDRAVDAFDLPGEVLAGLPKLTVTGNRRIHIECHKGIIEYDGSLIAVNGGAAVIRIRGENLEIVSMSAEEILIKGFVVGIEFE